MLLNILLTIFLVLLNGFFVAAEFAIVKVRASQIDLKANKGHGSAKTARHIVEHLDAYLSATQLGITLASLGLGWIGESVVADIIINIFHMAGSDIDEASAHKAAFPIAFALITVLHIVFGELAPKTIAIRHPLQTTMMISWPLKIFHLIFRPFIWVLNGTANAFLKLIGIKPVTDTDIHTEEELRLLLTESEEGGAIKRSEHELIQNVFEFDDRIVKQILVPGTKIVAIDIDMSHNEIIDKVVEEGYSRLPVYKDSLDNIIGVIHTKDLLRVIKNKNYKGIKDIIRPVYYIPMSKRINELLREFQTQHIQMAIVTNEYGETAGLVTMEDIIEELVGEIQDEHDEERPIVEKKSETEYIVQASAAVSDANEFLPIELPESTHYDTVSGLIHYVFGRIPAVNEKKKYEGYEIKVLKRHKHIVEIVQFKVLEEEAKTNS